MTSYPQNSKNYVPRKFAVLYFIDPILYESISGVNPAQSKLNLFDDDWEYGLFHHINRGKYDTFHLDLMYGAACTNAI